MAWGDCLAFALLVGGFASLVQGNLPLDGFSLDILNCVECFPPVPAKGYLAEIVLRQTCQSDDNGNRYRHKIDECIKDLTANWSSSVKKGMAHELEEYEQTVLNLCTEGTETHETYLKYMNCINKQFESFCEPTVPLEENPNECELEMKANICYKERVLKNCGRDSLTLLRTWFENVFREFVDCWRHRKYFQSSCDEQAFSESDKITLQEKLAGLEREFFEEDEEIPIGD